MEMVENTCKNVGLCEKKRGESLREERGGSREIFQEFIAYGRARLELSINYTFRSIFPIRIGRARERALKAEYYYSYSSHIENYVSLYKREKCKALDL